MVVHPCSHGISRAPRYSGSPPRTSIFRLPDSHRLWLAFPCHSAKSLCDSAGPNPEHTEVRPVWPLPRSLATTNGISVDFSSSPYLDVSVRAVPLIRLWIQRMIPRYCRGGFPHSEICGSTLMCSSPQLIAACRVLHRLLMPRHSPCALISLTYLRRFFRISAGSLELCRPQRSSFEIVIVTLFPNAFRHPF